MQDLIFVYGTLMRGVAHPMAKLLSRSAAFLGEASCRGQLYMIAHYPGLILSDTPDEIVHGQLYRMHEPDTLLRTLDEYENCGSGFAEPTAYLREIISVTRGDGSVSEAWTYVYNWDVLETKRIASGRFLER
jgi:gamma-glutamylcyclotransferase (GGCT)/AIG2-like uncharacterized protein YtfP